MSEMAKRIARAIIEKLRTAKPEDSYSFDPVIMGDKLSDATIDGHFDMLAVANGILEAMREPTKEMIEAGAKGSGEDSDCVARGAWEAMIDAALKVTEPAE
jgi:hypothetical protein